MSWSDSLASWAFLLGLSARPTCSRVADNGLAHLWAGTLWASQACPERSRRVPDASLHAYHALDGPRQTLWNLARCSDSIVWASRPLTRSPSALETCVPSPYNGAVSSLRECGLPCGLHGSLCTLQLFRSEVARSPDFTRLDSLLTRYCEFDAMSCLYLVVVSFLLIAATLAMGEWLVLTQ